MPTGLEELQDRATVGLDKEGHPCGRVAPFRLARTSSRSWSNERSCQGIDELLPRVPGRLEVDKRAPEGEAPPAALPQVGLLASQCGMAGLESAEDLEDLLSM